VLAVDKEDLVPPVPVLTRYKKELGIKAFVKKEIPEVRTVDERKASEIVQLTISKLCVRLNSLYVSFFLQLMLLRCFYLEWYQVLEQFLVHKDLNEKKNIVIVLEDILSLYQNVVHMIFFRSQATQSLTRYVEKYYICNVKYIYFAYIDLILQMFIYFSTYLVKAYIA
jgi:hypothetical protein